MFRYLNKYHFMNTNMDSDQGHRTEQPVMQFLSRIYSGLNKETPEYTLGIFLDLKKHLIVYILKSF